MAENTKECPNCAMKVDKKHKTCPICEHAFDHFGTGKKITAGLLLLLILLWLVL